MTYPLLKNPILQIILTSNSYADGGASNMPKQSRANRINVQGAGVTARKGESILDARAKELETSSGKFVVALILGGLMLGLLFFLYTCSALETPPDQTAHDKYLEDTQRRGKIEDEKKACPKLYEGDEAEEKKCEALIGNEQ